MSKKTAQGLYDVGQKILEQFDFLDFDEVREDPKFKASVEHHKLHEADINIIEEGFDMVEYKGPDPDDMFPFKVNGKTVNYGEVHPKWFRWFWKQDFKKKHPEVIQYIKSRANWLKKRELDREQQDQEAIDEVGEIIKGLDKKK